MLNKCRICNGTFFKEPLLTYPNSPGSAQGFLDTIESADININLKIFQCSYCGVVQHDLAPVVYYRDVIRAIAFSKEMATFRKQQLGQWVKDHNLIDKKILEIGCGKGEYIKLLLEAGAQNVSGIENSIDSVAQAKLKGLDVKQGYLDEDLDESQIDQFDAFAIFSFMEHWPDVNGSLKKLHRLLKQNSVGIVEVPNFEFVLEKGLYSEFTTDHIFYFDKKTLSFVLEFNGFEVTSVESVWHDYILSAKVKKRNPINTEMFSKIQKNVMDDINIFLSRFNRSEVVIWGAGHQALAVMSMANLSKKVSHVVDSASFKQEKYTPGTLLKIKAPQSIHADKPKAIIIMAAAYSDEVYRQIRSDFSEVQNVAILRDGGLEVLKHES